MYVSNVHVMQIALQTYKRVSLTTPAMSAMTASNAKMFGKPGAPTGPAGVAFKMQIALTSQTLPSAETQEPASNARSVSRRSAGAIFATPEPVDAPTEGQTTKTKRNVNLVFIPTTVPIPT